MSLSLSTTSFPNMASRLPAELTDYIIDFLCYDRRTLASCSMVCRKWLPVTRYHLFSTILNRNENVERLIDVIKSPGCTLTNHIICVHLDPSSISIVPYLERFMAITTLVLFGRKGLSMLKEIEGKLPRGPARLMKMDLTSIATFIENSFRLTFTLSDFDSRPTFLSRLRSLCSVIDDDKTPEFTWLLNVAQFPAITEVHVHCIRGRHVADIQAILCDRGPSIHSLRLKFDEIEFSAVTIGDLLDLSPCTNLRSFDIGGLNIRVPFRGIGTASISKIISRLSSRSLTDISISVWIVDLAEARRVDWKELAEVLNHPQFSGLRKVSVKLYAHGSSKEWVQKEMSGLASSRALTVELPTWLDADG